MQNNEIRTGDKNEALNIMREAANWLDSIGIPLWSCDELTHCRIKHPKKEFVVLYKGNESVAAMLLSEGTDYIWREADKDSSMFLHKLCVKRKYAGKGYSHALIEYAKIVCRKKNLKYLRLDCDANRKKLCAFYVRAGFTYVKNIRINTNRLGKIDCALFEMDVEEG